MNYLAHIYLSGDSDEMIIGNFIADSVRGGDAENYSSGIQKGIALHREIDRFTDSHPVVEASKKRLRPKYHKFAPVIADVFYDHFLAAGWSAYSSVPLQQFSVRIYQLLTGRQEYFPPRSRRFLQYMVSRNILVNYARLSGIGKALRGLASRARFDSGMEYAVHDLENDYELYLCEFREFFPELIAFTASVCPGLSRGGAIV